MPFTQAKIRILLIDDDEDDFILFKNVLEKIPYKGFEVDWISTFQEAEEWIDRDEHDVYIIDYQLGADSGIELLKQFDILQRRQPFIMLTGAANGHVEKDALGAGAADYLVKGSFDHELLSRVIRYSLQRKNVEAQRINQLIEVNRSKDEFIAVASHELRTPATAVKQYIGMILEGYAGEIDEPKRNFLKRAYDSNDRQLEIIDDILRVARLDLQKVSLESARIDVIGLIRNVIRDAQSTLSKRQQTIALKASKDEIFVMADETYLRMSIANIIDNASKYSYEKGHIQIKTTLQKDHVAISISDNGVGIAQEDMERLFIKFSRIHNPLSIQRGGTGLGLYWSREIVKLHKGTIEVSSDKDGTTFTIELPLASTEIK